MKNWFVRGLLGIAAFTLAFALTAGADGAGFDVPVWVPFAGMALLLVGATVLRRGLVDHNDS